MTKVGYGNLTVNEGMQWEESGVSVKMCDIIVVWHTYHWWQVRQSLSPYRVIKRISGQTGVSLYGSVMPSHGDVTQGRYHVSLHGRSSNSFDSQQRRSVAVTGSSETAYFGGWTKMLHFMTRV